MVSAQTSQVWSDPINLSNSGGTLDPILIIDTRGVFHAIWVDQFDGYKYTESKDGVNWTSPQTVLYPFSPKNDSRPVIVTNVNGGIQIFWKDKASTLYYSQAQPETLGQPGAWTGLNKLTDNVLDFDVKTDSRGALHIVYAKSSNTDTSTAGVYYRKLDGTGWSSVKQLYSSKYFRSLDSTTSHVRLSVAEKEDKSRTVYVVWDDRLQKRIFLAKSVDATGGWSEPIQIRGPEDFTGSDIPFNVNISAVQNNVLLLWQAGEPGARCVQYSQWSANGGDQFADPVKVLDESVSCPGKSDFITQNGNYSVVLLNIQGDLSLIVWNGSKWSILQPQSDLSVFLNPISYDSILFGCQNLSLFNETLFIIGCDKGTGKDIWFRSRSLGSFDEWFPPPSAWTSPVEITSVRQKISSLVSIADDKNIIHAIWVQAPLLDVDKADATIQYAKWNDGKWTKPVNILSGFPGVPVQLAITFDAQGRLLLSWSEGKNGDLYFSWATADHAQIASEWSKPQQIPTPSQISSSPDILVDDSGETVVAYSVPLNENRGIYIVRSNDLGKSWTQPIRVFDAVAANWDLADQPSVSLSADGVLHLLFSRSSLRETDQTGGLYYVQSSDGGTTWSQPDVVTEMPVKWSQIVGFDKQILHRLWQENNGLTLDVFHQVSRDAGITWENPLKVITTDDLSASIALTRDHDGHLYIVESHLKNDSLNVDISQWDGTRWSSQEKKEIGGLKENAQYLTNTNVTSQGLLSVMVSITYPELVSGLENKVIHFSRLLDLSKEDAPRAPILIVTPAPETGALTSDVQITPTASSPLANLGNAPSSSRKNLVGLVMVGGAMILIIFIIWPRKKSGVD